MAVRCQQVLEGFSREVYEAERIQPPGRQRQAMTAGPGRRGRKKLSVRPGNHDPERIGVGRELARSSDRGYAPSKKYVSW